jgi:hypothetical protein
VTVRSSREYNEGLKNVCPKCGARPYERCKKPDGRLIYDRLGMHAGRVTNRK